MSLVTEFREEVNMFPIWLHLWHVFPPLWWVFHHHVHHIWTPRVCIPFRGAVCR